MPRPAPELEFDDARKARYQFGVQTILVLTTAVAIAIALVRPIPLPAGWRPYAIAAVVVWIGYLVMRTAFILRRMGQHRRRLRGHRDDLLQWADEVRAESPAADRGESAPTKSP